MRRRIITVTVAVGLALLLSPATSRAATISTLGDMDCFGLGGSCPDGTLWQDGLGGVFFNDYRDAGDLATAPFTDIWDAPGSVSYTHTYGTIPTTDAVLELLIAGIHDINTSAVYTVFFNGTAIGTIAPNFSANDFQEVLTYRFSVPQGLLTGSDTVSWSDTGGDGYSIDYSRLSVPEPATLLLLGAGLGAVAARRRLKKRA